MLGDSWGFPAGTLQVFRAERVERKSLVGSPDSLIISCTIWCSKLRIARVYIVSNFQLRFSSDLMRVVSYSPNII